MDNVTLIRDVSHPIPLESASPRRLTGILQDAGFTFDAVKGRLGTEYRQWSPNGTGVAGKFRAFFECAGMRADIGARMFGPAGSGILDTIAGYFKKRGPKDQLDLLIWLFLFNEPVKVTALSCIFSPAGLMLLELLATEKISVNQMLAKLEKQFGPHRYGRIDTHFPLEQRAELMEFLKKSPPAKLLRSPLASVKSF